MLDLMKNIILLVRKFSCL